MRKRKLKRNLFIHWRLFIAKVISNMISIYHILVCDLPPEYCMADKKDNTECKNWLKASHPQLY